MFRALADPSRRDLLDALREKDGRTLGQLCEVLPNLTRFGVAKHLGVLEEAGLIATRKVGRSKPHYLNAVPIQGIADRWIDRYRAPNSRMLVDLRDDLEKREAAMAATPPMFVQSVHIKAPREQVRKALIDPSFITRNYHGFALVADSVDTGARYQYRHPDGSVAIVGEVVQADPGKRLVMTFSAQWDASFERDRPSRVTYELEELGPHLTRLTLVHDGFDSETATYTAVSGGWSLVLDGLKTPVETGEPLHVPA